MSIIDKFNKLQKSIGASILSLRQNIKPIPQASSSKFAANKPKVTSQPDLTTESKTSLYSKK